MAIYLSFSISNTQEKFILYPIIIADEDKGGFESIQTKHVTLLAQDAVHGKLMKGWVLPKKVPDFGNPDENVNYM
mgnify:FL=1